MTIFLTPEELNRVLAASPFIETVVKAAGWKNGKVSVYPSRDAEHEGFEIDVEQAPEVEAP